MSDNCMSVAEWEKKRPEEALQHAKMRIADLGGEIRKLRAEVERLEKDSEGVYSKLADAEDEIARLKARHQTSMTDYSRAVDLLFKAAQALGRPIREDESVLIGEIYDTLMPYREPSEEVIEWARKVIRDAEWKRAEGGE